MASSGWRESTDSAGSKSKREDGKMENGELYGIKPAVKDHLDVYHHTTSGEVTGFTDEDQTIAIL